MCCINCLCVGTDNLDAAIDEGNQFGEDPLMPDQDPEGGDVAGNEKLLQDHRVHENRVHDDNAFGAVFGGNDLDRPLPFKNDNNGAEVETGDKNDNEDDIQEEGEDDNQLDDGAINDDNLAKENFFDEELGEPLRLDGKDGGLIKNPLNDRMVL